MTLHCDACDEDIEDPEYDGDEALCPECGDILIDTEEGDDWEGEAVDEDEDEDDVEESENE